MRKIMLIALIALGLASAAHAATASKSTTSHSSGQGTYPSLDYIGPRFGFSVDPDQVVVGGHLSAAFAPSWTFNPSLEFGFGDHETVSAVNFDAEYHFRLRNSNWSPYVGGGLGINFIHMDESPPSSDFNDTVTGLNVIFGTSVPTASGQRIFTELRLGAGDASMPELKGIFGFNFKL
jgi:opacity protein-like surface antigen